MKIKETYAVIVKEDDSAVLIGPDIAPGSQVIVLSSDGKDGLVTGVNEVTEQGILLDTGDTVSEEVILGAIVKDFAPYEWEGFING